MPGSILKSGLLVVLALSFFTVPTQAGQPRCLALDAGQTIRQSVENAQIDEQEIFTRLVFSEGYSTNAHSDDVCKAQTDRIYESIAWGVMNRVVLSENSPALRRKFGEGLTGVIFQPNQFNPAVSAQSQYSKAFLCPQLIAGWTQFWQLAEKATSQVRRHPQRNPFLQTRWEKNNQVSLVSHFYYPQSQQATPRPPSWVNTSEESKTFLREVKVGGKSLPSRCIWFFRHEKPFPLLARKQSKSVVLRGLIQQKVKRILEERREQIARLQGEEREKSLKFLPRSEARWVKCVTDKVLEWAEKGRCETFEKFTDRCVERGGLTRQRLLNVQAKCRET